MNTRCAVVALAAVFFLALGGAARAMHPSVRMSKVVIWCDGIDDETAEATCAVVENKKTGDLAPLDTPVWQQVYDDSPTSQDVRQACEAGDEACCAMSLLFRPRLRMTRCSARDASILPTH